MSLCSLGLPLGTEAFDFASHKRAGTDWGEMQGAAIILHAHGNGMDQCVQCIYIHMYRCGGCDLYLVVYKACMQLLVHLQVWRLGHDALDCSMW